MITFTDQILQTGIIKSCFKLGLKTRSNKFKKMHYESEYAKSKNFKSSILTDVTTN